MILGMGNFIIPFLVLLLTDKLGYSATVAGSLAMGITGIFLIGSFLGGKLSDLFGHKLIMVFGEFIGAVLLILCGFVADDPVLVPVFLFAAYFFVGLAVPASNALVADRRICSICSLIEASFAIYVSFFIEFCKTFGSINSMIDNESRHISTSFLSAK